MSDDKLCSAEDQDYIIRIRRRPFSSWLAWFLWFVTLMMLLEYAFASFSEQEPQAGIVAGGLFFGLLLAGLILEFVKTVESRSEYRNPPSYMDEDES